MLKNTSSYLTLNEVLERINSDTTLLHGVFKYSPNSPLDIIFKYAFDPKRKWILPEGVPPYTPFSARTKALEMMTPDDLLVIIKRGRLSTFTNSSIESYYREKVFIQTLEKISAKEAEILLAVKDQTLNKLYPNITRKVLEEAGYLEKMEEEVKTLVAKSTKPVESVETPVVAEEPVKPKKRTTKTTTKSTKSTKSTRTTKSTKSTTSEEKPKRTRTKKTTATKGME